MKIWQHNGERRPEFAVEPEAGQESVWDYPRPPRLERDQRTVWVVDHGFTLAKSNMTIRVLETAGAPTFYIPRKDVTVNRLRPLAQRSHCEWKGVAYYFSLADNSEDLACAWHYPDPKPAYNALRGFISFYPNLVECYVDKQLVRPQGGGFYGGWVTDEVVGPIKGDPGSEGW